MECSQLFSLLCRLNGRHRQRYLSIFLLLILLFLAICNEIAIYNIGLITGDYYRILNDRDEKAFLSQTIKSLALIVAISLLKGIKEYISSSLYVHWRDNITSHLHHKYFQNYSYYHLNVSNITENKCKNAIGCDNVDQRITQDVDKMTNNLSTIIPELIVSPFIIAFYSYQCYLVNGLVGPVGCIVFFLLSTLMNKFLVQHVSRYVYEQERCEGDFRFQHLRIRNYAESIAFLSGERMEHLKCAQFQAKLIKTQRSLILRQLWLKCSIYLADYAGSILSFISLSIPLFAGAYDNLKPSDLSKLISENAFFTMYLINCFTRLIDLSTSISIFLGTSNRICELYSKFVRFDQLVDVDICPCIERQESYQDLGIDSNSLNHNTPIEDDIYFDCNDVVINAPKQIDQPPRTIIKGLNFQIFSGKNVLITGPSGIGKTSLIRAMKGIWPLAAGKITRKVLMDNPNAIIFLPQKPVLTTGSLAEQIVYPRLYRKENYQHDSSFYERVLHLMRFLNLEQSILQRINYDIYIDTNLNWIDQLSGGEVQRLNLARILYHKPIVVIMDESTSALPIDMEKKIMDEFINNNITIISCGHRSSLKSFHQLELRLVALGEYKLIQL
ncbi:hypothetical protein RDWZM_005408 [Blomia tropicalis]|uniref:Uncharacterized protein n=1 Tax=Blomia tropicalis TaxID=40697 RepID=A0A9Q0RNF3_BLOTA|nr:hypothetical protein RDWZM_005408 [Blomia tropicalis]